MKGFDAARRDEADDAEDGWDLVDDEDFEDDDLDDEDLEELDFDHEDFDLDEDPALDEGFDDEDEDDEGGEDEAVDDFDGDGFDLDDLDDDEALGLDPDEGPGLAGSVDVSCPYCGAGVEMIVDPVGGDLQEYVEDCEVCCQPWSVRVTVDRDGNASVELGTLDEG